MDPPGTVPPLPSHAFFAYKRAASTPASPFGKDLQPGTPAWTDFIDNRIRPLVEASRAKSAGPHGMLPLFQAQTLLSSDSLMDAYARYLVLVTNGYLPDKAALVHAMSRLKPITKPRAEGPADAEEDPAGLCLRPEGRDGPDGQFEASALGPGLGAGAPPGHQGRRHEIPPGVRGISVPTFDIYVGLA